MTTPEDRPPADPVEALARAVLSHDPGKSAQALAMRHLHELHDQLAALQRKQLVDSAARQQVEAALSSVEGLSSQVERLHGQATEWQRQLDDLLDAGREDELLTKQWHAWQEQERHTLPRSATPPQAQAEPAEAAQAAPAPPAEPAASDPAASAPAPAASAPRVRELEQRAAAAETLVVSARAEASAARAEALAATARADEMEHSLRQAEERAASCSEDATRAPNLAQASVAVTRSA